jgi:hypothetical protein
MKLHVATTCLIIVLLCMASCSLVEEVYGRFGNLEAENCGVNLTEKQMSCLRTNHQRLRAFKVPNSHSCMI